MKLLRLYRPQTELSIFPTQLCPFSILCIQMDPSSDHSACLNPLNHSFTNSSANKHTGKLMAPDFHNRNSPTEPAPDGEAKIPPAPALLGVDSLQMSPTFSVSSRNTPPLWSISPLLSQAPATPLPLCSFSHAFPFPQSTTCHICSLWKNVVLVPTALQISSSGTHRPWDPTGMCTCSVASRSSASCCLMTEPYGNSLCPRNIKSNDTHS